MVAAQEPAQLVGFLGWWVGWLVGCMVGWVVGWVGGWVVVDVDSCCKTAVLNVRRTGAKLTRSSSRRIARRSKEWRQTSPHAT